MPDRFSSATAAELGAIVRELRETDGIGAHVTAAGLLASWDALVGEVERGYEDSVYEYANDVDSRAILDRVVARARPAVRDELLRRLEPLDGRFEAATRRASAPFHGGPETGSPWHWRVPLKLVGELRDDLEGMGLS